MISKKIIADIRELHLAKNRNDLNLFIAEGEKVVRELMESGINIRFFAGLAGFKEWVTHRCKDVDYYEVSEQELLKISLLQTPNQVLAVAEIPPNTPFNFAKAAEPLLLLDGIRDPGNMGTIIRTADWFGIKNIFCSEDCVDVYNPKVVQSAMGSLFRMHIHYGSLIATAESAKKTGRYFIAGAAVDGAPYRQCSPRNNLMLVIGSESHGISEQLAGLLDVKCGIRRALNSKAESLNAAVAAAVLLAHFYDAPK